MLPIPANVKLVIGIILVVAVGALEALVKIRPTYVWIGPLVQTLTALELYFTVPQGAQDKMRALAKGPIAIALCLGLLGASTSGCSPAAHALEVKVDQVIADDLAAGKSLAQIEADVNALLPKPASDIERIVLDGLTLLIDLGVLPPIALDHAAAMASEVRASRGMQAEPVHLLRATPGP